MNYEEMRKRGVSIRSYIKKTCVMNNIIDTFDWQEYINNYADLKQAKIDTKEKAWNHWINYGVREGRSYNPNYINFNWKEYINNYNDLKEAKIDTKNKAWNHWIKYGFKEGRSYDPNYNKFNWLEYINNNADLRQVNIDTKDKAWHHWINYGIDENRIHTNKNIRNSRICIIYVYYERINEQKNQSNLSFFIKYGMNKKNWLNLNITYLFVINNKQCEVTLPSEDNIHILKEDNCSDYEGWYNGIKYFENLYNKKLWEQFDYLCLINCSSNGPFFEENINSHWLIPFYNSMIQNNAVACSPYINNISNNLHLSCHFTLLKIDTNIINLLTERKVYNTNSSTYNTVLGPKEDKYDAIFTGEYGLSTILLSNNYKICCLYYDNINNIPILNITTNENREEFYHINNDQLKSTIFIKNVWRTGSSYASKPVLYDYCKDFINNKLKITNIFPDENYNTEHSKAEEHVIFPPINKNNSCVIYAHYDVDNIIADYVISSIKSLIHVGYDIIFYTASTSINNIDILPFTINFYNNTGVGTDWRIWLDGLKNIKNNNYEWIFLINDSLLFPINGNDNFKNTINTMREDSDFWGHWDSDEISWHIVGTPIEFKAIMIDTVINFIDNNIIKCNQEYDYINIIETKFAQNMIDNGYKYKVVINTNTITDKHNIPCPSHNPYLIKQWINNKNAFAIKWKYCISYLNNNIVSNEFNYLTRFLHYGPYGFISKGEKIGAFPKSLDFNQ